MGKYCDKKWEFTSHWHTVITKEKSYVCNTLYAIFVTFEQNVIGKKLWVIMKALNELFWVQVSFRGFNTLSKMITLYGKICPFVYTSDKDEVKFTQKFEVNQKNLVYCTFVARTNSFKYKCSDKNHLELTSFYLVTCFWTFSLGSLSTLLILSMKLFSFSSTKFIVCTPPPLSAWGGGGVKPPTKFSKRGLDRT